MRDTMRVAVELSAAFGQDVLPFRVIVLDERTLLGSDSEETSQSEAVLDWLQREQEVVGGDIRTISDIIGA